MKTYLRGLGGEEFANRAAAIMVDLNGVHPFREGKRTDTARLHQRTGARGRT